MKKFTALILITVLAFTIAPVYAASSSEMINVKLVSEDFNALSDETISSAAVKIANAGGFVEVRPRGDLPSDDKALFMGWKSGNDAGTGYIDINIPEINAGSCSFEFDFYLNGNTGAYSRLYLGEDAYKSHILSFSDNQIGSFMSLSADEWIKLKLVVDFDEKNADGIPLKWYIDEDGNGFVLKETISTKYFDKLKLLRLRPYFNFDNEGYFGIDNIKYTVERQKGVILSVNDGASVPYGQKQLSFKMDYMPENLTKDHISINSAYTNIPAQSVDINNETKVVSCIFAEDIKSATNYALTIDSAAYCSDDVTDNVIMNFATLAQEIDVNEPVYSSGTITVDIINDSLDAHEYNVFVVVYKNGVIDDIRNAYGTVAAGDAATPNVTISLLPTAPEYSYKVFVAKGWANKSIFADKAWTID